VIPAIQLAMFGYAIRTEVRNLPTVVLDESRTSHSRALVASMANTRNFAIVGRVSSRAELESKLRSGDARAAVVIPPTFARDIVRGHTGRAQVIVDAADPLASSAAIAGASLAALARSAEISVIKRPPPLEVRVRPWYNPDLRSSAYIVPGLVGVLLSLTLVTITSMAVVRERERGTLEQLIVTPIDRTSLMLGKILPFVLVGFIQMTVVLLLGKLLFQIPIRGSLLLLYALTTTFIIANLGLGLLMSTLAKSQLQAMQLGFFIIMPSILLSGFMFPREAMPEVAQWLGLALPLTYYLEIVRGVLLKGSGFEYLWRDTLFLGVMAAAFISLAVARFSKSLD